MTMGPWTYLTGPYYIPERMTVMRGLWLCLVPWRTRAPHNGGRAGRLVCRGSSPAACPALGQLQQLLKAMSSHVFNTSADGCSTVVQYNLLQCSPTCTIKAFFMFKWNFLCFSLCPLPRALPVGTTRKSLSSILLTHPIKYLCT